MPPAPDRLCADCRLALRPGERCRCVDPHVIRAEAVSSRQQLEALGRKKPAPRPSPSLRFNIIEKWVGLPLIGLFLLAGAAISAEILILALVGAGLGLGRYAEIRDSRQLPAPAPAPAPPTPSRLEPRGWVEATTGEVVGVSIALCDGDGNALLRGGWTDGFRVALEDGRTMSVRAGSVVVIGTAPRNDSEGPELEELLAAFPARRSERSENPFPRELVRRTTLRGGDRVRISADLVAIPDPAAGATGYRESAATVLSHSSVPELAFDHR